MDCFASDNRVFRSCDRYLNSSANLLKLIELCGFIWLFLIHFSYYCFHSRKLYKVCNIYPRSINSRLGIVLTVTNLTKDRYLNSSAKLLKLTELCGFIWLFLIHFSYYCFHNLKLYKVCNIYPRSINSLLGIVLTVTNLTKDRYLNSSANLLKLTELCGSIWLFLIHFSCYCFHNLKLYKVCNIYPRSINSLLEIVLTATNLTKDRYLNSGANLLKTYRVVWLYLALFYPF